MCLVFIYYGRFLVSFIFFEFIIKWFLFSYYSSYVRSLRVRVFKSRFFEIVVVFFCRGREFIVWKLLIKLWVLFGLVLIVDLFRLWKCKGINR